MSTGKSDLGNLRAALTGRVLGPGDTDYDTSRSVWNGEIDRRPAAVARCADPADVAATILFARDAGLDLTVRGGGHNFGGAAVTDGGVMIHLGDLNAVAVDPVGRTARCGGGTTWAQLDAATQAHGLAAPGGTISHTGVGGLTLGGGFGWLTSEFGLSCDNLLAATVVTADGQTLRAAADEHSDLFWALRGGGGNFGVVTEFEFQLHPVGPLVQLGLFFWDLEHGQEALRLAREVTSTLPPRTGALIAGMNAPPAPFVPPECHFTPGFALVVVGFGSESDHAGLVDSVRNSLPPLFDLVTPMPYAAVQQMLDESAPWGILGYEKAVYLDGLSDAVIALAVDQVPRRKSPMSFMPIFPIRGAFATVAENATAFGGPRQPVTAFNIAAIAPTQALLDADRAWVRGFWDQLQPHALNSGSYVNFMTEFDDDRVRATFGANQVRPTRGHQNDLRPGQRLPPQRQHPPRTRSRLKAGWSSCPRGRRPGVVRHRTRPEPRTDLGSW